MFRFLSGAPKRLKNILSHFKQYFTKPQYNNFCRTELALITAGKKEHNITSLNDLFINRKNQSTQNRFLTNPKWNHQNLLTHAKNLLIQETNKQPQPPEDTPNTKTPLHRRYGLPQIQPKHRDGLLQLFLHPRKNPKPRLRNKRISQRPNQNPRQH